VEETDYLVVESTYGNRQHPEIDPMADLGQVISATAARGGVVVIPAFAVGRAQALMYYLSLLKASGVIPALLPVFLDSPMAKDATGIYHKHRQYHRLTSEQCTQMCHAAKIVNAVEESKAIDQQHGPKVVIAASGMATGGRVLHHIKAFAADPRNTILFAGYQAAGTRGATMLAGAETVKIHGQYIAIRAQVTQVENLSAHADSNEIMRWLGSFKRPPRNTFITHGEPEAAEALRLRIQEELMWPCRVPAYRDSFAL
jgi:metallo-beta-lactamase family protein